MTVNVLVIEDNESQLSDIIELLGSMNSDDINYCADTYGSFVEGVKALDEYDYDIAIVDLCKGDPSENNVDRPGLTVLEKIQKTSFIPVVFYTGIAHTIKDLESPMVGVINKAEGVRQLESELNNIINSGLGLIKKKLKKHVNESLTNFFWGAVHENKNVFSSSDELSIGYLMLRRLANSLSKENIKEILGDEKISGEKAHPMEFYVYPITSNEYETAEILIIDDTHYGVILTPSCDFVNTDKRKRKADCVILAYCKKLSNMEEYIAYSDSMSKANLKKLTSYVSDSKGDRYFFLPRTPFLEDHLVVDFQDVLTVPYGKLEKSKRIAKLDSPFAESMHTSFIRYCNRVGYPDLDKEYIMTSIKEEIEASRKEKGK